MLTIHIDNAKFESAHQTFEQHLLGQPPYVPFTGFQHPFLVRDEIKHKWGVYDKATEVLNLEAWESWKSTPRNIIEATKAACHPSVSKNLLEHRFGSQSYSESALYRVQGTEQIQGLAAHLFHFFKGGPPTPAEFGPRFDAFADYLRKNRLGCKWTFLAYLAFLLDVTRYFPILPTAFDTLLEFYGIEERISGYVTWERYSLILDLADALKSKLAQYGQADAIEIQSYMWVVSYLTKDGKVAGKAIISPPDFSSELEARVARVRENERTGLLGEQFVRKQEVDRLNNAGRHHLASGVKMVSFTDPGAGYDVLSFTLEGRELHIEVKTTTRSPGEDVGFWLSETERARAEQDDCFVIYRVWNIDSSPTAENLGNIAVQESEHWELTPSSWYARCRTE